MDLYTCPICKSNNTQSVFETKYIQEIIHVQRCADCKFDFINNNLAPQVGSEKSTSETPEDIRKAYFDNYLSDQEVASESLSLRMPIFNKIFKNKINDVLEIGCSSATAYAWFAENHINWIGIEVDETALDHASKLNIPVSSANLEDFDCQFDCIYFHQVLEHVMDPVDFMKKVNKALRPGGVIGVGVPNNNGFTAIFRRVFSKKFPLDHGFIQIPYHLRAYNSESIKKIFDIAGFEASIVVQTTHFDRVYGEWYSKKNSRLARLIFNIGSLLGFGTLLYAVGRKRS
jgi:SAM-dependent methyltransferase